MSRDRGSNTESPGKNLVSWSFSRHDRGKSAMIVCSKYKTSLVTWCDRNPCPPSVGCSYAFLPNLLFECACWVQAGDFFIHSIVSCLQHCRELFMTRLFEIGVHRPYVVARLGSKSITLECIAFSRYCRAPFMTCDLKNGGDHLHVRMGNQW
jgi:hypothetical protein